MPQLPENLLTTVIPIILGIKNSIPSITMNLIRTLSCSPAIFALVLALPAGAKPPKQVECDITKGTNPGGLGHYTGKAVFSRENTGRVFKVTIRWILV